MFNFQSLFQTDQTDYQAVLNGIKKGNAQLVDIREKEEWDQVRFKGAVNVPLSGLSRGIGVDKLKKIKKSNKKIYLHCRTGSRVRLAEKMLSAFGCNEFEILPATMHQMANKGFELT